jgi:hypothetical protein
MIMILPRQARDKHIYSTIGKALRAERAAAKVGMIDCEPPEMRAYCMVRQCHAGAQA